MKKYFLLSFVFLIILLITNSKIVSAEEEVNIGIKTPVNNTTTESNIAEITFDVENATNCWYDLGNPEPRFEIPNCQSIAVDFGYEKEVVLNVWAENELGSIFDSTWFKTPKSGAQSGAEEQVEIKIISPSNDSTISSREVELKFETKGNPTKCWYDLGGEDIFTLPNCSDDSKLKLDLSNYNSVKNSDFVLNLYASKGDENIGLDSSWFKLNIPTRRGGSSGSIVGRVLGQTIAEEGKVLGASTCSPYLTQYIKYGNKNNNKEEVKKLQEFLNENLGLNLTIDGNYGLKTYNAVKAFQVKYSKEILDPWFFTTPEKAKEGTGYVYKTTQRWINMLKCPELKLPILALI